MEASPKLWEAGKKLVAVAQGLAPADLVVKNGRLVNVFTGEILPGTGIAAADGRIALVGDVSRCIGPRTRVVDAQGMYLTPAFLDGHLHVESSMLSVCEYGRVTLPHGTGAIFMDPHEIVNVLGIEGMRAILADARRAPIRVYATSPSCVPACPGLEDTGADFTPGEVAETMEWEDVAGLGEVMNYPGVLSGADYLHEEIAAALKARKAVTGHFPDADTGNLLNAYAACGIGSCHESTTAEQALAKLRLGMYAMIREGSAWRDLRQAVRAVTEHRVDTRRAVLVSDDIHADDLLDRGHMDHIIRLAVREGVSPVAAIQMATLNCAECFGLSQDLGALAPGRFADINILSDLARVEVRQVILGGVPVAEDGALLEGAAGPGYAYPAPCRSTMRRRGGLTEADFALKAPAGAGSVNAKIIEGASGQAVPGRSVRQLPVENGKVSALPSQDLLKVAVIDRHHPEGRMSVGFVHGFGIRRGAAASTYAHDAHNLIVVGADESDMACAANRLIACQGGMIAVERGETLALLELPVAGVMSERPADEVARKLRELQQAWQSLGCTLVSPFMTLSSLSLSVIPALRITNRGLVDVSQMKLTSLFEKE